MAHFDKYSDEYISNGHYRYENQEWMSIWAYKRNNVATTTENTSEINGSESTQLIADGVPCHTCKPEIGSYNEVFIFPVDVLGQFYNYHSS